MRRLDGSEVEAALSKLYDRYSQTVFGVGLKMLGERSLAEELVQEVFLKVWRSAHTFDPSRGSFSTWLYRVTRSVALDLHWICIASVLTGFARYPTGPCTSPLRGIPLMVLKKSSTNPGCRSGCRGHLRCSMRRTERL